MKSQSLKSVSIFVIICYLGLSNCFAHGAAEIDSHLKKADSLYEEGQYQSSLAILKEIASKDMEDLSQIQKFRLFHGMASDHFELWQLKEAEEAHNNALDIALSINDSAWIAATYTGLANIYTEQRRYGMGILTQNKVLKYFNSDDSLKYYQILSNTALAYSYTNQKDKALENFLKTKAYFSREKDSLHLAIVENNIGELYRTHLDDAIMAEKHYRNAIAINLKAGQERYLLQNYHNLAIVFNSTAKYDSAMHYAMLSKSMRGKFDQNGGMALTYNLLGEISTAMKNYPEALEYFRLTLDISEKFGIEPGMYYGNLGLGDVYLAMNIPVKGLLHYRKAEEAATTSGANDFKLGVLDRLYNYYKKNGQFEEALAQLEKKEALEEEIEADANRAKLDELRLQYEYDLAEAENLKLRAEGMVRQQNLDNQRFQNIFLWAGLAFLLVFGLILARAYREKRKAYTAEMESKKALEKQYAKVLEQEEKLKKANDFKNMVLSVLGHDLRTPLAGISQLLPMVRNGELTNEELEMVFNQLQGQTESNLQSLQNIMQWARNEIDGNKLIFEKINIEELVEEALSDQLIRARAKGIDLYVALHGQELIYADRYRLRSILQNLVSNAIKFSPIGGAVHIDFTDEGNYTRLDVTDSGEGMDPGIINRIMEGSLVTNPGTKGEKGTGVGLRLVMDFVKAHGGIFRVEKGDSGGTGIAVILPKEHQNIDLKLLEEV